MDSSRAALSLLVAHARDKPPRMFQNTYAKTVDMARDVYLTGLYEVRRLWSVEA